MSSTRLSDALLKINSLQNVNLSAKISASIAGAWSQVNFYEVPGVNLNYRKCNPATMLSKPMQVAISTFRSPAELYETYAREKIKESALKSGKTYTGTETIEPASQLILEYYTEMLELKKKEMFASMTLLCNYQIPVRYNLPYLAYTSAGQKISLMGQDDLYNFINDHYDENKEFLHLEDVRRIIGQMLLAIYDLHANNLLHRDIKLENFIVSKIDGKFFVSIADHNELETDRTHSINIPATADYAAPELMQCLKPVNNIRKYNQLNKKAIDCFALGFSIEQLAVKLFYYKERTNYNLGEDDKVLENIRKTLDGRKLLLLIGGLTSHDPMNRLTIEDAMQNTYFGIDCGARLEYFANLISEAENYQLIINGEKQPPCHIATQDNFYLLMAMNIKCVLRMGTDIYQHLKDANTAIITCSGDILTQEKRLKFLTTELNYLLNMLKDMLDEKPDHADYIELKASAEEELQQIKEKSKELNVMKLLYIASETLAQFPFTWASHLFSKRDEVIAIKQFDAQLKKLAKENASYTELIGAYADFLGKETIMAGSIKEKLNANLTRFLGDSVKAIHAQLTINEVEVPQLVA
jgi:serine/threonine protein kinase